jgi:GNAT superfamily N-acetyltransferase
VVDVSDDSVRDAQRDFPQYRIWREATGGREPRYVAKARRLGVRPYTVMTADLAELRAALAVARGWARWATTSSAPQSKDTPACSAGPARPGGSLMTLHWVKEDTPRWDPDKQRLFGPDELAAAGYEPSAPGAPVADEWWRVTDDDGTVVGYGRLDSEWGNAEITFLVDPARRGAGIGAFILDRLEEESAARGLNYIYNVIPSTHPAPDWITHWLTLHSFVPGASDLRRQVRHVRTTTP